MANDLGSHGGFGQRHTRAKEDVFRGWLLGCGAGAIRLPRGGARAAPAARPGHGAPSRLGWRRCRGGGGHTAASPSAGHSSAPLRRVGQASRLAPALPSGHRDCCLTFAGAVDAGLRGSALLIYFCRRHRNSGGRQLQQCHCPVREAVKAEKRFLKLPFILVCIVILSLKGC